jgi:hypothetical protein
MNVFAVVLGTMTLPGLYERYESEVDHLVARGAHSSPRWIQAFSGRPQEAQELLKNTKPREDHEWMIYLT